MPETIGRYELIAEIGRGGMADVKLALERGPGGDRLLVLKVLHGELARDPAIVEMMRAEAKLSALLQHPNIVEVYEFGEADGKTFIAMEYLEGESLLAVLDRCIAGKRLDPLSMARIVADATQGLAAAHDLTRDGKPLGLVHHDISLGNIFVRYSGHVKLLDFGVAKVARRASSVGIATDPKLFGKLAYAAPEKLDDQPGDHRSDIWSLGCVLWEALTCKRLFKGANDIEIVREVRYVNVPPPSSVNADVPPELDAIAQKALQRDPSRRYQHAKDLATALEDVLAAQGYPSKNYKIGTYMMQTFADVIAARERLVREVAGPHRPSAEVIDAAFAGGDAPSRDALPVRDPVLGALNDPDPTLDPLRDLLSGANQVVLPEGSTGADAMVAMPSADALAAAPPTPPPVPTPPPLPKSIAAARSSPEAGSRAMTDHEPELVDDTGAPNGPAARRLLAAFRSRPLLPFAIGGAIVAMLVIVLAVKRGGSTSTSSPAAKPTDPTAAVVDPAVAQPEVDAVDAVGGVAVPVGEAVVGDGTVARATAGAEVEIEMPVDELPTDDKRADDKPADKPRPRPTKSAQQYYAEGLAAWNKNDRKTAYARFTDGRRASSTYPNNWYGLGLVHEKAGRKKDARTAYERYLQLAPRAPNGAKLRDHIKKNLM